MALPKLNQPLFEVTIPSTKQKVTFRPFTVKEEKILLIAQESKEVDQLILAIKQIITNCIDGIDVDKLAIFDLEYLLINIRAKSVDNTFSFKIKDPDTSEEIELELDIGEIEVKFDPTHTKKIKLNPETFLIMKYPSVKQLKQIVELSQQNNSQKLFEMMISCFDSIASGDSVYKLTDHTEQEIEEFVNSMSSKNIADVKQFFETMPSMSYEKKYKNKLGEEKTFVVRGTETFFI
jgi:hypothetical protein